MKILLFGGTTEGRLLAERLSARGYELTVSVATEMGAEELRRIPGLDVRVGRLNGDEIRAMLGGYTLCIDATHPYAERVSELVRGACRELGVPLRRVVRAAGEMAGAGAFAGGNPGGGIVVSSAAEAGHFLAGTTGNVLLTTGAKELPAFAALSPARLYARILPTHEGLAACEKAGLPHRNIIAMQGPFSVELNEALLRLYAIRWVVTKDGGQAGGFREKMEAARRVKAGVLVIARPAEEDGVSLEALLEEMCGAAKRLM